ncbi:MAG: DUF4129 domain-containing protein [Actinomycetales bacterium]|nr:DUF4129 domain-containing protein [Actinomycetales bacterium]
MVKATKPPAARTPGTLSTAGLVAITLLTFLAVWTAVAAGRWSPRFSSGTGNPAPTPTPTVEPPPPPIDALPDGYGLSMRGLVLGLLVVMAGLAVVGLLGYGLRMVRSTWQDRAKRVEEDADGGIPGSVLAPDTAMPDVVELREGIAEAWARLAEHREPTDAIQAAWVAVEDAAGRSGVPREDSATPTEFTVAVLDRTEVDPAAIRTLLGLYHRARYSTHGATVADVELAGRCLTTLAEGLDA